MKQLLFLTRKSPFLTRNWGQRRDQHLIRLLRETFEVEILCHAGASVGTRRTIADGIPTTEIVRPNSPLWRRPLSPLRPDIMKGYSDEMAAALRMHASPGKLLWISTLLMGQYIPLARKLGFRVVLDEHHVESGLMMDDALSSLLNFPSIVAAAQCRYYESRLCKGSHALVATSELDACRLQKLVPKMPIHVIPHLVDAQVFHELRQQPGKTLFFSGHLNSTSHLAGLEWFINEVLPRLRAHLGFRMPRVVIAGQSPPLRFVHKAEANGIEVVTQPDSSAIHLGDAAVAFFPMLTHIGPNMKILEAMAAGRPVVSTGKAAEGLMISPSYDILVANSAEHFTTSILKLLEDRELREAITRNALQTIEARHDWQCARPRLEELVRSVDEMGE